MGKTFFQQYLEEGHGWQVENGMFVALSRSVHPSLIRNSWRFIVTIGWFIIVNSFYAFGLVVIIWNLYVVSIHMTRWQTDTICPNVSCTNGQSWQPALQKKRRIQERNPKTRRANALSLLFSHWFSPTTNSDGPMMTLAEKSLTSLHSQKSRCSYIYLDVGRIPWNVGPSEKNLFLTALRFTEFFRSRQNILCTKMRAMIQH